MTTETQSLIADLFARDHWPAGRHIPAGAVNHQTREIKRPKAQWATHRLV